LLVEGGLRLPIQEPGVASFTDNQFPFFLTSARNFTQRSAAKSSKEELLATGNERRGESRGLYVSHKSADSLRREAISRCEKGSKIPFEGRSPARRTTGRDGNYTSSLERLLGQNEARSRHRDNQIWRWQDGPQIGERVHKRRSAAAEKNKKLSESLLLGEEKGKPGGPSITSRNGSSGQNLEQLRGKRLNISGHLGSLAGVTRG